MSRVIVSRSAQAFKFQTITPTFTPILRACFCRVCSWRVPPNWSSIDWFDEVSAIETAAACQAECDYAASRGIRLDSFIYNRVMSSVLTRYRQEWTYALRFISDTPLTPLADANSVLGFSRRASLKYCKFSNRSLSIRNALVSLPKPHQWLISQLFWYERSENEIAKLLGISQRAVSKRKQVALRSLREKLNSS
jgi:Sigma-70, region 4